MPVAGEVEAGKPQNHLSNLVGKLQDKERHCLNTNKIDDIKRKNIPEYIVVFRLLHI